jgi:hypothetical protein
MPTNLITLEPFHLTDVSKIHCKAGLLMVHVQRTISHSKRLPRMSQSLFQQAVWTDL